MHDPLIASPEFRGTWRVTLTDDAMAPRAPAGKHAHFDPHGVPRERDGVLIEDADGALHVRQFEPQPSGEWVGRADNPAFPAIWSEDGARVVGVLVAIERGWRDDAPAVAEAAAA